MKEMCAIIVALVGFGGIISLIIWNHKQEKIRRDRIIRRIKARGSRTIQCSGEK